MQAIILMATDCQILRIPPTVNGVTNSLMATLCYPSRPCSLTRAGRTFTQLPCAFRIMCMMRIPQIFNLLMSMAMDALMCAYYKSFFPRLRCQSRATDNQITFSRIATSYLDKDDLKAVQWADVSSGGKLNMLYSDGDSWHVCRSATQKALCDQ